MCGRFTLALAAIDALGRRFPLGTAVDRSRSRFNITPGDQIATVAVHEGVMRSRMVRWGLIPPWATDPAIGYKMINARAETVAEKPAYREAFRRRRCVILADGFYEWQVSDGGPRAAKQPFHVTRSDGAPFAFAGLWSGWRDPTDRQWLHTATIITTAANERLAAIHPRMPVMLDPGTEERWLDPATPPAELVPLLAPLPAASTSARPVSRAVNDARYDGPACLDDAAPDDLAAFAAAVNAAAGPPAQGGLF